LKIRYILFLLFAYTSLFATTLLTYNTYDREDRVDLMLSFDTPYNGKIFLKKSDKNYIITLNNISFEKKITKNINSKIVQEISIYPINKGIEISLKSDKDIGIVASKTTDGFGLRIRAKLIKTQINSKTYASAIKKKKENTLSTSKEYGYGRYYAVLSVLLILILILLFVKKRALKQNSGNWLFKNSAINEDVKVLYRKMIDNQNSVIVLEYKDRRYLVLTGASNQLLDKFSKEGYIQDDDQDEEFEKIFAKNREKLDEFLKVENVKLSDYMEKAGKD